VPGDPARKIIACLEAAILEGIGSNELLDRDHFVGHGPQPAAISLGQRKTCPTNADTRAPISSLMAACPLGG